VVVCVSSSAAPFMLQNSECAKSALGAHNDVRQKACLEQASFVRGDVSKQRAGALIVLG